MVSYKINIFIFILCIIGAANGSPNSKKGKSQKKKADLPTPEEKEYNIQLQFQCTKYNVDNDIMIIPRKAFQKITHHMVFNKDEAKEFFDLIKSYASDAKTKSPFVFCNEYGNECVECLKQLHRVYTFSDELSALEIIRWIYNERTDKEMTYELKKFQLAKINFASLYYDHIFYNLLVINCDLLWVRTFCQHFVEKRKLNQQNTTNIIITNRGEGNGVNLPPKENIPDEPTFQSFDNLRTYMNDINYEEQSSTVNLHPKSIVVSNMDPFDYYQRDMTNYGGFSSEGYFPSNTITSHASTSISNDYSINLSPTGQNSKELLPQIPIQPPVSTPILDDYSLKYIVSSHGGQSRGQFLAQDTNKLAMPKFDLSSYSQRPTTNYSGQSSKGYLDPSPFIQPASTIVPYGYSQTYINNDYGAQSSVGYSLPDYNIWATPTYDPSSYSQESTTSYGGQGSGRRLSSTSNTKQTRYFPYSSNR